MKKILKKVLPEELLLFYHYFLALLAAFFYRFPSRKIVVIGITGTKGKTSAANFIWSTLQAGGFKTGMISTANIRIGEKEKLNSFHMTMPGRFALQKILREMVDSGCTHCVIETTSEGLKQFRHIGIHYDIAVFMNLFPEHLSSHGGSFEKYRQAKGRMFKALSGRNKVINGKKVPKIILANLDSPDANFFLNFSADEKITFGTVNQADFVARDVKSDKTGAYFRVADSFFELSLPGDFNATNALPAIIISRLFGVSDESIQSGLKNLIVPGRMEIIDEGQDFTVMVDYAHEKESMSRALEAARKIFASETNVIVLLGAEGGGRDKPKRSQMGEIAGLKADCVVVSNVDPYDDDPREILEEIAAAVEKQGKVRDRDLFVVEDRKKGIRQALSLARKNDIVVLTGKGAEQSIIVGNERIPWDDRMVVRQEIQNLLSR